MHILAAGVATVDGAGVGGGVPPIYGGLVMHAWVGAFPSGLGNLSH